MMKRYLAAGCLAGAFLLGRAFAESVISVNVGANGALAPTDVAGLIPVANWNDLTGVSNPSSSSLVDNTGASVPGTSVAFQGSANTFNANPNNNMQMLSGFLNGNPMTVAITGIPYAQYDVYVYYAGFVNNYSLTWTATETGSAAPLQTVYSVRGSWGGPQAPGGVFVESSYSSLAIADAEAADGNGGNYFKFSGLSASNLTIAETSNNGFNENGFSGIQIAMTVPEPTSIGLLGAAAVMLLSLRRRLGSGLRSSGSP